MQIWAESGKSALPICNYSQILYQFLTFTQNLKRSQLQPFLQLLSRKADSLQNHPFSFFRRMQRSSRFASALIFPSSKMARPFSFLVYTTS